MTDQMIDIGLWAHSAVCAALLDGEWLSLQLVREFFVPETFCQVEGRTFELRFASNEPQIRFVKAKP